MNYIKKIFFIFFLTSIFFIPQIQNSFFKKAILKSLNFVNASNSPQLPDPNKIAEVERHLDYVHNNNNCTVTLKQGDNLQTALNNSIPGDIICLQAGAVFDGNYILPVKNNPNNKFITIVSTRANELPVGLRVNPSDKLKMAKITYTGSSNNPTIKAPPRSSYYRFVGLELANETGRNYSAVVVLGESSSAQSTISDIPHHFIFDRVYIHGVPPLKSPTVVSNPPMTSAGIFANANYVGVANSYITDIHDADGDNYTFVSINSEGGFLIQNNFLHASGENIMIGGSDPAIVGLVPADMVFRGNHFYKDPQFRNLPTDEKNGYAKKNLFELKFGRRILVQDNIFENHWESLNQNYAIVLKTSNQYGGEKGNWVQTSDVIFEYNLIKNVDNGFNIGALCESPGLHSKNILIRHNIIENVGIYTPSSDNRDKTAFQIVCGHNERGVDNLTIEHNTVVKPLRYMRLVQYYFNSSLTSKVVSNNFIFRDNIVSGMFFLSNGFITDNINLNLPGAIITGNVIANVYKANQPYYPAGNFFPNTYNDVGFIDYSNGNYQLSFNSPYKNKASDGTDPGADINALNLRLRGVIEGTYRYSGSSPSPPPPPSPLCPSAYVSLANNSIQVGQNTTASAPSGWSGGVFISSNTSVATVSGSTITGRSQGTTSISGSGWTAPNGATNCSLSGATLNVIAPPSSPTVDLKVNNQDGPITIDQGSSINLSWSSQNADTCQASGSWSGSKNIQGSETIGPINSSQTFILTCTGQGGIFQDDVTVNLRVVMSSPTLTSDLELHYDFEQVSNNNVQDLSGKNRVGVINGNAKQVPGKIGQAFDFDGLQDYIVAPSFNLVGGMTIAAWVNLRSFGSGTDEDNLIRKGISYGNTYGSWLFNIKDRKLFFTPRDISAYSPCIGSNNCVLGSTVLNPNTWYFIAATYDGSTMRVYLNGKPDGSKASGQGIAQSNNPIYIGGKPGGGSDMLDGLIDDLRIYSRALSDFEIEQLYSFLSSNTTFPLSLIVDLKVNNQDGSITVDQGSSVTLSWTSQNANTCQASGSWSGSKNIQGSETIGPISSSQTFILTCRGDGGEKSDSVTVNIRTKPSKPPLSSGSNLETVRGATSSAAPAFSSDLKQMSNRSILKEISLDVERLAQSVKDLVLIVNFNPKNLVILDKLSQIKQQIQDILLKLQQLNF